MEYSELIQPNSDAMANLIAKRRQSWHGFDRSSCQWMMTAEYHDLNDVQVVARLNNDFQGGRTQLRVKMTGMNVEAHDPNPIYAFKIVQKTEQIPHRHLVILHIDPQTGQLSGMKQGTLSASFATYRGPGNIVAQQQYLNNAMEELFTQAAQWHKETFGVGPVAPSISDNQNQQDATDAMLQWSSERAEVIASRTPQASGSSRGMRL